MNLKQSLKQRLQAAVKGWNQGDWVNSDLPGNRSAYHGTAMWIPGSRINWDAVTGEIIACPAVQACFNYLYRNLPQAPPVMRELDGDGEWQALPDHPITKLLARPNPAYDGATLLNQIVFSLFSNGNAYILQEFTGGGDVAELWWWPHNRVTIGPDTRDTISEYILTDLRGMRREVPADRIIHLKWGLDPEDWRFGMSPLAAAKRSIYSLQQSANYRANILRNFGTVGAIISAKNDNASFDPVTVKQAWRDKTRGDNVGDVFASDVPLDVHFPGVSPQSMAIETMDDRPEADVCALFGLPPQVVGLHVGRLSKTYANLKEAREVAWEECLMPIGNLLGSQLGYYLIPQFASAPRGMDRLRLGFDYRDVRPLQPDRDAENTRELAAYMADAITLGDFCRNTDRPEPRAELRDLYYSEVRAAIAPQMDAQTTTDTEDDAQDAADGMQEEMDGERNGKARRKASDWSARIIAEVEEIDRIHEASASAFSGIEPVGSGSGRNGVH